MFEQPELKDRKALIWVESRSHRELTSALIGMDERLISPGWREYSFSDTIAAIAGIDKALSHCANHYKKRFMAERSQFIMAFGPEMEEYLKGE